MKKINLNFISQTFLFSVTFIFFNFPVILFIVALIISSSQLMFGIATIGMLITIPLFTFPSLLALHASFRHSKKHKEYCESVFYTMKNRFKEYFILGVKAGLLYVSIGLLLVIAILYYQNFLLKILLSFILAVSISSLCFFLSYTVDRNNSFLVYFKNSTISVISLPKFFISSIILLIIVVFLTKLIGSVSILVSPYLFTVINFNTYQKENTQSILLSK